MAGPLDYMPSATYQFRRPARRVGAAMGVAAVGFAAAGWWAAAAWWAAGAAAGGDLGWGPLVVRGVSFVVAAAWLARGAWLLARGGAWDVRIEQDMLVLARPGESGPQMVPLAEIDRLEYRHAGAQPERAPEAATLDLWLTDGRSVRLPNEAVGRRKRFAAALLRANPRIRYLEWIGREQAL